MKNQRGLRAAILRPALLWAILVALAPPSLLATGILKGTIRDRDTKETLPGANVVLKGTNVGSSTDLNGAYTIQNVPAGQFTVTVTYVGYRQATGQVTIVDNQTTRQDFTLRAEAVEGQEVVVTAQAQGQLQAINQQLASDKIVSVVSEARIQELPDFNAAQALSRLPGVSTLQSSGEANKVVIRGLAPKYNAVALNGITLASTGSTQIGAASQGGTAGAINTDRSVDISMITPYMLKSVEVYKSLTPDMDANAIGGHVNMELREAPEGLHADVLAQSGYTQKSGKYGNYRFVGSASDRFLDGDLGVYVLANAERYDRNADNMNATYATDNSTIQANGFRAVTVTNVTLNRHLETRERFGGNLILDYKLPSGSIKMTNVLSRLSSDATDYNTSEDYQGGNLNFTLRQGNTKTDMAVNALQFSNDFDFLQVELRAANTYSRNFTPGSPQYDFSQTNGIPGRAAVNQTPEAIISSIKYQGPGKTYLANVSLFSADYKENDQVFKADLKAPFKLQDITSGYVKAGGEFRYNYHTNDQGTPYAGMYGGTAISNQLQRLIIQNYGLVLDPSNARFPSTNFTSGDGSLTNSFLDDRFGSILWAGNPAVLNGITTLLARSDSINGIHSSGQNPGGWFDSPYQRLPNKYKYVEKYYASYLMSELNFGQDLLVVGGVRWEEVQGYFDAYNLSDGRDASNPVVDTVFARPSNRFLLPMVQAKYNVTEWADLRYSYTQTLARPDYSQLSPHFNIGYGGGPVWAGNPKLVPARALNHDLYLTFHSNDLGLLSVGGFYKEVRDFTFATQYTLHQSAPPGLDSLGSFVIHTASGQPVTPRNNPTLFTFINSPYKAFIRGLEVDFQHRFWYLPEPFNGTVFGINYTHIKSEATYPRRIDTTIIIPPRSTKVITLDLTRPGRLINQPDDVVNAYIGYDLGGFSGRLSLLFQGNSVNTIGAFAEQDGFTKDYFRIDASVRQKLPIEGLQVFLDVFNLNNRQNEAAQASINGFTSQQYYGLTANLGVRYTM